MKRNLALWVGVLGGPVTWLCSFEARFALAPWACTFQSKLALYAVAVLALLLCVGFAALSWREWKALGEHGPTADGGALARSTFMAIGGVALSLGCFVIIFAQTIPELVLGACQ
jgi:heme/copper-type cytochrome/quinol oxidase subunit 3